jgi:ribosome-associated protein
VTNGRKRLTQLTSIRLAEHIADAALEKKAGDVVILDLRKLETLTDFFVICTGEVDQHVRAIAEHIEQEMRKYGEKVLHREGTGGLNWVLLDYVNVVVHVFRPSFREFYRLEDLWGDAEARRVGAEEGWAVRRQRKRRAVVKVSTGKAEKKAIGTARRARAGARSTAARVTKVQVHPSAAKKTVKKVRRPES